MNRLPPLRALQIFDAVIRYGGVVAAAEALYVTPGAISQQIRVLEEFLGVTLFERENTGLRPTPLCELYHSHISRGFECFHSAQAALKAQTGPRLTLMTFPSVATHWLASRLDKWHTICPHVQVHVEVVDHETSIAARSADVRLTYGALPSDGTPYHVVFTDKVAPVFAPSLLQAEKPIVATGGYLALPADSRRMGMGKLVTANVGTLVACGWRASARGPGATHLLRFRHGNRRGNSGKRHFVGTGLFCHRQHQATRTRRAVQGRPAHAVPLLHLLEANGGRLPCNEAISRLAN